MRRPSSGSTAFMSYVCSRKLGTDNPEL
jgi:hypothetical protein